MRPRFFIALCILPVAVACAPSNFSTGMQTTSKGSALKAPMTYEINTRSVEYGTQDGNALKGYLAVPRNMTGRPAVIVIHEWQGLNENMRERADILAKYGFVTLAVDLYGMTTTDQTRAVELATALRTDPESALDNLAQAVAWLQENPAVDDARIATVGWDVGGGWAYEMAKQNPDVKAAVIYYGQFSTRDNLSTLTADILGHFGEEDDSIRVDEVKTFETLLRTLSSRHAVFLYPDAGHGFATTNNPGYNRDAARKADTRTLEFLQKSLR